MDMQQPVKADNRIYWSIDHERTWLASRVVEKTTPEDKERLVRDYMTALTWRHVSFMGDNDMEKSEFDDMITFCLRLLYEIQQEALHEH